MKYIIFSLYRFYYVLLIAVLGVSIYVSCSFWDKNVMVFGAVLVLPVLAIASTMAFGASRIRKQHGQRLSAHLKSLNFVLGFLWSLAFMLFLILGCAAMFAPMLG